MEAEVAILGSIMLAPDVLDDLAIKIAPEHFYNRANGLIYRTILELHSKTQPIDSVTLTNLLKSRNILEEVGGAYHISKLSADIPTSAHADFYAKILQQKLQLRQIIETSTEVLREAYTSDNADELFRQIESKMIGILEGRPMENLLQDAYLQTMERLMILQERPQDMGLLTGIDLLDKYLGGLVQGRYIVAAARPGAGKTALIEQQLQTLLFNGHPCLLFQKDMSAGDWFWRFACRQAGISVYFMERTYAKKPEHFERIREAAQRLSKLPLYLYSPERLTGADIRSIVRREKRRHGIEAVFLDHMLSLQHNAREDWQGISENSSQIRQSCNESRLPHFVVVHVNREGEKSERPRLAHIKGSDRLEADSDTAFVLWASEKLEKRREADDDIWQVHFAFDKNRWGPKGEETLHFNGTHMRFEPKDLLN